MTDCKLTRMNRLLTTLLMIMAPALGAQGPSHLNPASGSNIGSLSEGWNPTGTTSPAVAKESNGCMTASCWSVAPLSETTPTQHRALTRFINAAPFRGKGILFRSWVRLEAASPSDKVQLWVTFLGTGNRVLGEANSDEWVLTGAHWVRIWLTADVGTNVRQIGLQFRIVGSGRVLLDDISADWFDAATMENDNMAIQRELGAMYAQLDKSYAGNSPIPAFLVSQRLSLTVPTFYQRAADVKVLSRPGVRIASETRLGPVRVVNNTEAIVEAKATIRRISSEGRQRTYLAGYRDYWMKSAEGEWKLFDRPALDVQDITPAEAANNVQAMARPPDAWACGLKNPGIPYSLGPTDYKRQLRAQGTIRGLMAFVDFSDAPPTESAEVLHDRLVRPSNLWIKTVSNGIAALSIESNYKWYRMPGISKDYDFKAPGYLHIYYVQDAIRLLEKDYPDITRYDIVYLVPAPTHAISRGFTFDFGVRLSSGTVRHVVVFDETIYRTSDRRIPYMLTHETVHTFGLPDLYDSGSLDSFVGVWDSMSWMGPNFTAWNLAKLGWLAPEQVECVNGESAAATLSPVEIHGGLKALVVPMSSTRAFVIEAREIAGVDLRTICNEGILVYTVDTSVRTLQGPMRVIAPPFGGATNECGLLSNAVANQVTTRPLIYSDGKESIEVVLSSASLGAYRVRVARVHSKQE